jgi:Flp pilus assembly protein TadB
MSNTDSLNKLRESKKNSSVVIEKSKIGSKEQEEIEDFKQRRELREGFDKKVFWLLIAQVVFVALMLIFQGFKVWGFSLNEWAFGIFVNGALVQTYFIVRQMAIHLFPKDLK